jgi:DNA-binding transcriptional LysR family regulator
MSYDVRRMLLLAEVARQGSLTGAATTLNYTPSAVSQQVSRLEAEVGQPLVQRHVRGVSLTEAGHALVEHAERIDRQLQAARRALDEIAGLHRGTLRLGTFPTIAASLLPYVVRSFRTRHPAIELFVHSARRPGLLEMLESRQIELSLLWDYPWRSVDETNLEVAHLLDDPTALVVGASHPMAHRESVEFAELAQEHWIVREDHPVAEVLTRSCRAAGFEPRISYRAHDYQEAQAMAAVGLGIVLAPRFALAGLREDIAVLGLGPAAPARRILLAHLRDQTLTPAAQAITEVFVAAAHAVQPPPHA